jgi:hypothetical protein
MLEVDQILVYRVRKLVTGANVHYVNTLLFCYESAPPGSRKQAEYELKLRAFVAEKELLAAARYRANSLCRDSMELLNRSEALEEDIENTRASGDRRRR